MIQGSIAEFELRCRFYIGRELEKIDSDTALIALLSDAVRLGREYSDKMQR